MIGKQATNHTKMNKNDLHAYLTKLNINQEVNVNLDTLTLIHQKQHRTLPFENFDIALGKGIAITREHLIGKLVQRNRGGYCFELNALLLDVLQTLGFEASAILARVHLSGSPTSRTHQLSLVTLEGQKWVVDAGFGSNTPRAPLPLITGKAIHTDLQTFRFVEDENWGYLLQVQSRDNEHEWLDLYSLDLSPVVEADLVLGNYFTSTSPDSRFTTNRVASRPTPNGLITLENYTLKIRDGSTTKEITLEDNTSYLDMLKLYFDIEIDANYLDLKTLELEHN